MRQTFSWSRGWCALASCKELSLNLVHIFSRLKVMKDVMPSTSNIDIMLKIEGLFIFYLK